MQIRNARRRIIGLVLFLICVSPLYARHSSARRLTILLSNDDGYSAPGLQALIRALSPADDVYVAAPADNESGKGHSITVGKPIYVEDKMQPDGRIFYAIQATPATCVRLGLNALLAKRPDVVISGINRGENLGMVVYYSGTLGAAREAVMSGIPAIAVSLQGDNERDYASAASYVLTLLDRLQSLHLLKAGFFLNVNFPSGEPKGVRVTRLGFNTGRDVYNRRIDAQGRPYFWPSWQAPSDDAEGTDVWAFMRGYITLTPLSLDETAPRGMNALLPLEQSSSAALGK